MLGALLDLLFPRRCLGCGLRGWPFCRSCLPAVAVLSPPGCLRCGRPLEEPVDRCADCPPPVLTWSRSALLYRGPVRRALMRLKFGGWRGAAEPMAAAMASSLLEACPAARSPRVAGDELPTLTWVPLGRRRHRARGFDQAEALAREVGRLSGLPVRRLLRRTAETGPQARRSGLERRRALRGAFVATARPPPRVILVDDVLTTGATASACATTIRAAGAREVGLLTAARALGGALPSRCYNPPGLQPGSVVARETSSR